MKNTGDNRRVVRVERELQHIIAKYLISGFKTPFPGLVTVARVLMPGDLRSAKVYISVLGEDKQRKEVFQILKDRVVEVQNHIGRELRMRYCPKITFYEDHSTENLLKVDRILHDLHQDKVSSNSNSHESEE